MTLEEEAAVLQARRRQRAATLVILGAFALAHYFDLITLRWGNALIGIGGGLAVIIWSQRLAHDYIYVWSNQFGKQVDERTLRYFNIGAGLLLVIFGLRALIG